LDLHSDGDEERRHEKIGDRLNPDAGRRKGVPEPLHNAVPDGERHRHADESDEHGLKPGLQQLPRSDSRPNVRRVFGLVAAGSLPVHNPAAMQIYACQSPPLAEPISYRSKLNVPLRIEAQGFCVL
jgi:hypothetical protein